MALETSKSGTGVVYVRLSRAGLRSFLRLDNGGCQLRPRQYVLALTEAGLLGSMAASRGADNAAMESFFSLLQKLVRDRKRRATREELHLAIVIWIERTYHHRRRREALAD